MTSGVYAFKLDNEFWYIGSSKDLRKRYYDHCYQFKYDYDMKFYHQLKEAELEPSNLSYVILEECENYKERERDYILEYKPFCNVTKGPQTREQYLEYQKQYHEEVRSKKEDFNEKACEARKRFYQNHKDDPEFKKKNAERNSKYYQETAKARKKEKVNCPQCTKTVSRVVLNNHLKICKPEDKDLMATCEKCNKTMKAIYLKYQHKCSKVESD